jgi:phosphoribosylanthranilate isomerase
MTWVKICGTTNLEDALAAVEAGADALGFIFAPSPRRIEPQAAREIVRQVPEQVEKVGVFVNETSARIRDVVKQVGLNAVQLHGDETLEFAEQLFPADARPRIYQAVSMKSWFSQSGGGAFVWDERARKLFSALVVDSGSPTRRGGTGLTFDWSRAQAFIASLKKQYKVIVAGGLNPENAARAVRLFRPWGVDVTSGVEREPGKKDPEKMRAFVAAVHSAAAKERA